MSQLVVIGITGVARSGKDTIARILCSRFGFVRIALADGIRSAFRDMDGPTWELTKELEAAGLATRWGLQTLGTEARDDIICDDLWCDLAWTKIAYLANHHPRPQTRFVVPDMRYPHEPRRFGVHAGLRFPGSRFQLWRSVRDGAGLSGPESAHQSETAIRFMNADVTIVNNSGLDELETVVSTYARQLLEPSNGHRDD